MIRLLCIACLVLLAACSKPTPKLPDKERPVDPKSAVARHPNDDLAVAINDPLQRAKGVQATLDAAAQDQAKAMDAAERGDTSDDR